MRKGLSAYLTRYYNFQKKILLVYHPTTNHTWGERCYYLGENYHPGKRYNHRSILDCEVVIEFDDESEKENKRLAEEVSSRLHSDYITHNMWFSGNKSYHIHIMLELQDITEPSDVQFLKRVFTKHYTYGIGEADMQLCGSNHLVRAEYGVHEKTRRRKSLIRESKDYPFKNPIPQKVMDKYHNWERTPTISDEDYDFEGFANTDAFKMIADAEKFGKYNDGKKRALFVLIQTLKHDMNKEELVNFIQRWYKNVGGYKLSAQDLRDKVDYHYDPDRTYTNLERFTNDMLKEIGAETYIIQYNN